MGSGRVTQTFGRDLGPHADGDTRSHRAAIGMRDQTACEAVAPVAYAAAHVRHRRRRHADAFEPCEARDAGLIDPDAGIVENERVRAGLRAQVRCDQPSVGTGDQHRAAHPVTQLGDGVCGQYR